MFQKKETERRRLEGGESSEKEAAWEWHSVAHEAALPWLRPLVHQCWYYLLRQAVGLQNLRHDSFTITWSFWQDVLDARTVTICLPEPLECMRSFMYSGKRRRSDAPDGGSACVHPELCGYTGERLAGVGGIMMKNWTSSRRGSHMGLGSPSHFGGSTAGRLCLNRDICTICGRTPPSQGSRAVF